MISKRRIFIPLWAFVLSLAVFFLCELPLAARELPGPSEVIKNFNAALIEAMKRAGELGYSGRYRLLDPVVRETFALSFMAGQSTGRYWKKLPKDEREAFIRAYTEWTIATYAGRFDGYSGQKFEIVSEDRPLPGIVAVTSRLVRPAVQAMDFRYLLRNTEGSWRIVDIQIAGVSQLALTRAQFTDVIKTKGIRGLTAMLKEKIRTFEKRGEKG